MGYALHKYDALYFCIFVTAVSSYSYSFRMGGGVPMGIGHVWGKDFASSIWEFILEKLCHNCQNRFFFFCCSSSLCWLLCLIFGFCKWPRWVKLPQVSTLYETHAPASKWWRRTKTKNGHSNQTNDVMPLNKHHHALRIGDSFILFWSIVSGLLWLLFPCWFVFLCSHLTPPTASPSSVHH